jgi:immune inhibitor A
VSFVDVVLSANTDVFEQILGGVQRFYDEVSAGMVRVDWKIAQPVTLHSIMAAYANGNGGRGIEEPNAATMARDALSQVSGQIQDFQPFDGDSDQHIDGFVVVHAGHPAESFTNDIASLIWSHRGFGVAGWAPNGYQVNEFLTVSEESPVGVWCHELGHLLFNWPDLYEGFDDNGPITHTWLSHVQRWLERPECGPSAWRLSSSPVFALENTPRMGWHRPCSSESCV